MEDGASTARPLQHRHFQLFRPREIHLVCRVEEPPQHYGVGAAPHAKRRTLNPIEIERFFIKVNGWIKRDRLDDREQPSLAPGLLRRIITGYQLQPCLPG